MEKIKFKDLEVGKYFWYLGNEWVKESETTAKNKHREGSKTVLTPNELIKVEEL